MFFSIIVPVYKVEEYLPSCIESVLNQTYKNYEIIMIDDSSIDNSVDVIGKFNIDLLKTNRLQAGGARNLGLKHATGDYVVFLDSDDYVKYDMFEKLYNKIEKSFYEFLRNREIEVNIESNGVLDDISTEVE